MGLLFEKLDVYQRALDFSENIETLCENIPRGKFHLIDQVRRASLSISLNIAEGTGRWHRKDKKQFYLIARGSAYECIPILDLLRRKKLIDEQIFTDLKNEVETMAKMLTKLVQSMDK
jgi:four helix bundle protein